MGNTNYAQTAFTVMEPASTYCDIVSVESKVPGRTCYLLSRAASIEHGKRSSEPIRRAISIRTEIQVHRRLVFHPRYSTRMTQRVFGNEEGTR